MNCGSRCPLKMYVKDGTVVRVGNDNDGSDDFGPNEIYQMRSCVRGRTNRQRLYNDSRIQTPLRRVAGTKRGEGKYEAITWDEAISDIADAMTSIKEKYGNDAFYIQYGTGQLGGTVAKSWAPDNTAFARLLNCFGGYLRHYCDYSTGQIAWELPLFNGDAWSNNEVTNLVNSKAIVLFGNNPANTRMSGSAMQYILTQVHLQNPDAKIVVIDPILSDTAVSLADQSVPDPPRHRHGPHRGHDPLHARQRQARRGLYPRQLHRLLQRHLPQRGQGGGAAERPVLRLRQVGDAHR